MIHKSLGWRKVFLLSLFGLIGGVIGQIIFDLYNNYTNGLLSSFLVSIIVKPLNYFSKTSGNLNFWPSFDMAIFLFRWILGAGAIGLSLGIALQFRVKRALFAFIIGCFIGLTSWLATGYLVNLVSFESFRFGNLPYIPTPFMVRSVLPCIFLCFLLSLAIRETRPFSLKFMLAGFLSGLLGTILSLNSTSLFIMQPNLITISGINIMRIKDAIFVMFFVNLICLIFLKESLKSRKDHKTEVSEG